jgi:hypothetical protein
MNATINLRQATEILELAIKEARENQDPPSGLRAKKISSVILGTHKTYRYILLNGLLAKATNVNCNPLALQAGSSLEGAFDARSLCHKVVVPAERERLGGRLGASNEPFLNKPARFAELSPKNAVRGGRDTNYLRTLIDVFESLGDSEDANIALREAIYFIFERPSRDLTEILSDDAGSAVGSALVLFSEQFLSESIEGETCALLAGAAFSLAGIALDKELAVLVHPINQSGASSNEILDVDVYLNNNLLYTVEVKDKDFSEQDVEHAVGKAASAGEQQLLFLIGPRGQYIGSTEAGIQEKWRRVGFSLLLLDLLQFFKSIVAVCPTITSAKFVDILNKHARASRVKDETIEHLKRCIAAMGW